jgi:hypothetical protein
VLFRSYKKLQRAYGEYSLSRAQVFRWHKSFLEGREQVEDEPRAGRPTSKMDDNLERVRSDNFLEHNYKPTYGTYNAKENNESDVGIKTEVIL